MHGRILYDIYGLGWQLLASFWDSLTTFLSHRNAMQEHRNRTEILEDGNNIQGKKEEEEEEQNNERQPMPLYPHLSREERV